MQSRFVLLMLTPLGACSFDTEEECHAYTTTDEPASSECPGTGTAMLADTDNSDAVGVWAGTKVDIFVHDPSGDGGYSWWVVSAGGLGGGDMTVAEYCPEDSGMAGGDYPPNTFTFTTAGLATASYDIHLVYGQSWDDTTWIPHTFHVEVTGCP